MERAEQGASTTTTATGPAPVGPVPGTAVKPVMAGLAATALIAIVVAGWGWSRAGGAQERASSLEAQVAQLQTQVSQFQGQVSQLQGQVSQTQGRAADLEKRLADASAQRDALAPVAARVETLARERQELLDERNLFVQRFGSASWGREEAERRASGLEVRLVRLTEERDAMSSLADQAETLGRARAELLDERNALVQRVGSVGWQRDEAERRAAGLEARLGFTTARLSEIEARTGGLDALARDAERLRGEIAASERRVTDITQALELATRNLATVGEEIAQRTSNLASLRRQQDEARAALLEMQTKLIQVHEQAGSQVELLKSATK